MEIKHNNLTLYKKEGDFLIPVDKDQECDKDQDFFVKESELKEQTEISFSKLINSLHNDIDNPEISSKEIFNSLENVVENMFLNVECDSMSFAPIFIKKITKKFLTDKEIFGSFVKEIDSDNDLAHRSLRVLFFTLAYCYYNRMSFDDMKKFGLISLFYSIGKTKIDPSLLVKRKLTDEEFEQYKKHRQYSVEILSKSKNEEVQEISKEILKENDDMIKAINIIDDYEQLTSPRRKNLSSVEALTIINKDIFKDKFSQEIFEKFSNCVGAEAHK